MGGDRSGLSAVSVGQEMSSGKFRLFPPNSAFFPAISTFFFRLSWLDFRFPCCLTLEIQCSSLWLQVFKIQEHAENHARKCSRAEYLHKSCFGLFSAARTEFRLTGCFWVHFLKRAFFYEMAVFSRHLEAPGRA